MKFRGAKTLMGLGLWLMPWLMWMRSSPQVPRFAWLIAILMTMSVLTNLICYESAEAWLEETQPGFVRPPFIAMFSMSQSIWTSYKEKRRERGLAPTAASIDRLARIVFIIVPIAFIVYEEAANAGFVPRS